MMQNPSGPEGSSGGICSSVPRPLFFYEKFKTSLSFIAHNFTNPCVTVKPPQGMSPFYEEYSMNPFAFTRIVTLTFLLATTATLSANEESLPPFQRFFHRLFSMIEYLTKGKTLAQEQQRIPPQPANIFSLAAQYAAHSSNSVLNHTQQDHEILPIYYRYEGYFSEKKYVFIIDDTSIEIYDEYSMQTIITPENKHEIDTEFLYPLKLIAQHLSVLIQHPYQESESIFQQLIAYRTFLIKHRRYPFSLIITNCMNKNLFLKISDYPY